MYDDKANNAETVRRVAFTSQMVDTQPPLGKEGEAPFVFQKVFSEGDFMAGGLLVVPRGKEKPLKPSRDNSYVRLSRYLCPFVVRLV